VAYHYSYHVFWSDEDGAFIATVSEFSGVSAFGETPQEALQELLVALEGVIEMYQDRGWELPQPRVLAQA
jgi:predicted RNase H-like HicB family nuclease